MTRRTWVAALLAVALAACPSSQPPQLPEVRVHATVGDAATAVLVQTARARGLAAVQLVASPADAEIFWLADPAEVVVLAGAVKIGRLPPHPDTDSRLVDPQGRFQPVCARGRLLLVNPRVALPFQPKDLRDLADPRASGRIAMASFDTDEGASTAAALTLAFGEGVVSRFLEQLARNEPIVMETDAEVRDRVARGDAAFGLVGSEVAAAAAASAAGLEVVAPDQGSRGAILLPTAVAVAEVASEPAVKLAHWLGSVDAEEVLVARLPGLMPLREGVPVPVGVQPTRALRALIINWDHFAAEKRRVRSALASWPEPERP